jgi:signal transduction histidine kinase
MPACRPSSGQRSFTPIDNRSVPRRRIHLRTILTLLVLATTAPLGLFAAQLIRTSWSQQQMLVSRQNVEQARAASVAVDQEVDRAMASLHVLAGLEQINEADRTQFTQIAAGMIPLHRGWEAIKLVDPSLRILADTNAPRGQPSVLVNPDWVRTVLATREPAVSTLSQDPSTGDWLIAVGIPVRRSNGSVKYVLGLRMYAQAFTDILNRARLPPDAVVTLLDTQPVIIARTRNQDRYIGRQPTSDFIERSRSVAEGSWRTTLLEGTPAYSAWTRSPLTGWTIGVGLPSNSIDGPIRRSFVMLTALGLAILVSGIVLASYLSRGVERAYRAAAHSAGALARGEAVPPFGSRIAEADDLSTALREAAAILQTRMRERDEAQREVDRNRTMLLQQEQTGRRAAEALSRAKDEFVATVSHELRTPLNAIYGWVALLKNGHLDAERHAHALEVVERNTRAQAQLIEDLLDMSQVIRGAIRLDLQPVDLSRVLEAAVDSVKPTAAARQITITVVNGPDAAAAADQRRLQQVLWNILANALKFTPAGGRVDVGIAIDGRDAVIRISDTGEGIAPEFLPHVFERFRQESGDITRTHSGLGIGLALVRHLVELHGGTVHADSPGKGKGSTFSIRLPSVPYEASRVQPPEGRAVHADSEADV